MGLLVVTCCPLVITTFFSRTFLKQVHAFQNCTGNYSQLHPSVVYVIFFTVVRTLNMRSTLLTDFLSEQYSFVRHNTIQQISRTYLSCIAEILYLLISNFPLSPHPSPWQLLPFVAMTLFKIIHINGIMHFQSFCAWLISFSVMFRHVATY